MTTSTPAPSQPTYRLRCVEDLLAIVPVTLGFEPADSLVLLTFEGPRNFHARVDLPPPDEAPAVEAGLLAAARRHRPGKAAVVVYSDAHSRARSVARRLLRGLDRAGIRAVDAVRAHDKRWYPLVNTGRAPACGVPYDAVAHPFRTEAVFSGQVVHGSRDDLAATLRPDPATQQAVAAHVTDLGCPPEQARREVAHHLDTGRFPDAVLARLLVGMRNVPVRDAAWALLDRANAEQYVRLWADAVRRAPERLVPAAAGVLAISAWQAGHGALAWCAVDRCRAVEPGNSLARLVDELLSNAVPPNEVDVAGGAGPAPV